MRKAGGARRRPKRTLLRMPLKPNVMPAHKVSLAACVDRAATPGALASHTKRFAVRKDPWLETARQAEYNIEKGDRAAITARIQQKKHLGVFSKQQRFVKPPQRDRAVHADYEAAQARDRTTPHGDPYRHTISIMRSKTPRFSPQETIRQEETRHLGPGYVGPEAIEAVRARPFSATMGNGQRFVDFEEDFVRRTGGIHAKYDTDTAHKMQMASMAMREGHGYNHKSAFSPGQRFAPPGHTDRHMRETMQKVEYEPKCFQYQGLADKSLTTHNEFKGIFDASRPRFVNLHTDPYLQEAISYMDYNTDTLAKATMSTISDQKKAAPVKGAMENPTPRFRPQSANAHLGPGRYDWSDEATKPRRPASAIGSAPRFKYTTAPPASEPKMGKWKSDDKHWTTAPGGLMNTVPRPSFVKKNVVEGPTNIDQGPKMTLSTAVAKSPRRMAMVRSKQPRLAERFVTKGTEHLGPGYVDPITLNDGRLYNIDQLKGNSAKPSGTFASNSGRFRDVPIGKDPHVWRATAELDYDTNNERTIAQFVATTRQGEGWATRSGRPHPGDF